MQLLTSGFRNSHCSIGLFFVVLISSNSTTLIVLRKMRMMSTVRLTTKQTPTLTLMMITVGCADNRLSKKITVCCADCQREKKRKQDAVNKLLSRECAAEGGQAMCQPKNLYNCLSLSVFLYTRLEAPYRVLVLN